MVVIPPGPVADAPPADAAAAPVSSPHADGAVKKAKKKRDNNPGVRVQGGRIYDSEKGTTCHQVSGRSGMVGGPGRRRRRTPALCFLRGGTRAKCSV